MKVFFLVASLVTLTGCSLLTRQTGQSIERSTQITPSPEPTPYQTYSAPEIETKEVYIIALLGDSMMEALGPLGGPFSEKLGNLYQNQDIIVDNYSVGSTNILSIDERLRKELSSGQWSFKPLIQRDDIDLIVVGSFAYNPLSHITDRKEALETQNKALTDLMMTIEKEMPQTKVVFLSTIAPSKEFFGKSLNLDPEKRLIQVQERKEYLANHIAFANKHSIPVIDVYHESLNENGDGNLEYINPDDFIHPSAVGVDVISSQMAEFIYDNNILPRKVQN